MKNRIYLAIILFLGIVAHAAHAQVFSVKAFDGTDQKITVLLQGETLKVACLSDTIVVNARFIQFVNKVGVLNGQFLRIDYSTMAGSGLHAVRTVFVCINNKHLIEALHVTSLFSEDFIDFSKPVNQKNMVSMKSINELTLKLSGATPQTYQMNASLHSGKKLRDTPERNYDRQTKTVLYFDPRQNIFFSKYEILSRNFNFYSPKANKETRKYVKGRFPVAILGNTKCYYINGEWYEDNNYGDLSEFSYR